VNGKEKDFEEEKKEERRASSSEEFKINYENVENQNRLNKPILLVAL
jgi:hypothetical protein